jgi:hypothetical protein
LGRVNFSECFTGTAGPTTVTVAETSNEVCFGRCRESLKPKSLPSPPQPCGCAVFWPPQSTPHLLAPSLPTPPPPPPPYQRPQLYEMGAQETAVEEVLRAAAAEVSTSSVKCRLRLFRHTLPPLLSKATGTQPYHSLGSSLSGSFARRHPRVSAPHSLVLLARTRALTFSSEGALRSDGDLTADSFRFTGAGSPRPSLRVTLLVCLLNLSQLGADRCLLASLYCADVLGSPCGL